MRALCCAWAGLVIARPVGAQNETAGARQSWPSWMVAWSPLRAAGDPATPWALPPDNATALETGPPRIGLLWTAANPAALNDEIDSSSAWLEAGVRGASGSYRRPLDPADVRLGRFDVLGWRRFGAHSGAIGRVSFADASLDPGPLTDVRAPYAMDPFVLVDTTKPDRSRLAALLEGGMGWTWGTWGAGFLAGIATDKVRTTLAAVPRVTRATLPAVTVGVSRMFPGLHARIALHGRWIGGSETSLLMARTGRTTAFILGGYYEPDSILLAPPSGYAYRRTDRDGLAGGVAFTARTGRIQWAALAEGAQQEEAHRSEAGIPNPALDRWASRATKFGLSAQAPLGSRWMVTGRAQYGTTSGDATRADLSGVAYRASQAVFSLDGDVRLVAGSWTAGIWAGLGRTHDVSSDFVAGAGRNVVDWIVRSGAVLARSVGRASLGVMTGVAGSTPIGQIPDPGTLGPVYQGLVAPAVSFDASPTIVPSAAISARAWVSDGTSLYVQAGAVRLSTRGSAPPIPAAPIGSRTSWDVAVGLTMGRRPGRGSQ
jgi:hypothetical protein